MTTIVKPPGKVSVTTVGSLIRIRNDTAKLTMGQANQDYVPVNSSQLSAWLDLGDIDLASLSATRAAALPIIRNRPSTFATIASVAQQRSAIQSVTTGPTMNFPAPSVVTTNKLSGRTFLRVAGTATAADGPVFNLNNAAAISTTWTLAVLVRSNRLASPGYGIAPLSDANNMVVLASPTLVLSIPVNWGVVPVQALTTIGGAAAQIPWDLACYGNWRLLAVRSDGATNRRTVLLDGWPVFEDEGTLALPVNTSFTVGPDMDVAELMFWGSTAVTNAALVQNLTAQQTKWQFTNAIAAAARPYLPTAWSPLPSSVSGSALRLWLDATHDASLFRDTAGAQTAADSLTATVRRWNDRSASGFHVQFAGGTGAMRVAPSDRTGTGAMNGRTMLLVSGTAPGAFLVNPASALFGGGAFTWVAVWRVTLGGGHPLTVAGKSRFGAGLWKEMFGSDGATELSMPDPVKPTNATVVMCVDRSGTTGVLTVRLDSLASGGRYWTSTAATPLLGAGPTLGAANCGLQLGELMVWNTQLGASARADLATYLTAKWGVALPGTGGIAATLPSYGGILAPPTQQFLPSSATTTAGWVDTLGGVITLEYLRQTTSVTAEIVSRVFANGQTYSALRSPLGHAMIMRPVNSVGYLQMNRCMFFVVRYNSLPPDNTNTTAGCLFINRSAAANSPTNTSISLSGVTAGSPIYYWFWSSSPSQSLKWEVDTLTLDQPLIYGVNWPNTGDGVQIFSPNWTSTTSPRWIAHTPPADPNMQTVTFAGRYFDNTNSTQHYSPDMDFYEMLYYNQALSTADFVSTYQYLKAKYGM